jgi:hypothetical protein
MDELPPHAIYGFYHTATNYAINIFHKSRKGFISLKRALICPRQMRALL